uniref:Wiskott-Aldrich syndrome protein family member n=1 Tax=Mesocestoides corti TaxID=53468 RepID=A0A5K3F9V9_MESCO
MLFPRNKIHMKSNLLCDLEKNYFVKLTRCFYFYHVAFRVNGLSLICSTY